MTRFSSAVALSILGFCFAYGCSTKEEDDDDDDVPTTTGSLLTTSTGGTGGTSSGAQNATSGGGSGGSGGTSSGTDGEVPIGEACPEHADLGTCGKGAESAKPKPVNMLIVLDKSGSMDHEANGVQKWAAMKDALGSALEEVAENINFGLELYPTPELLSDVIDKDNCGQAGNCCEMPDNNTMNVPIGSGTEAVELIVDQLNNTDPGGGTPTARALERALEYFTQGDGAELEGDKYVLLATDGGPNCNSGLQCGADLCTYNLDGMRDCSEFAEGNCCEASLSQDDGGDGCVDSFNVVDRLSDLQEAGIETFVVGIPGTEAYSDFLDEFAEAGGRAVSGDNSYYRVDNVSDLTDVFREITVQLVTSCELAIPESSSTLPPKVVVDCEIVPRFQEDGAGGAGNEEDTVNWEWEAGSDTLTLVGDACERVSQGVDRIDVVVDCDIPE